MTNLRYTRDHEYIRVADDIGTIGITSYAQEKLGDIVFVELPEVGRVLVKGQEVAVVESVKAASEVYAPVGGEVVEVNEAIVRRRPWSTRTRKATPGSSSCASPTRATWKR
jgi:glycine cleavage system H protein